MNELKRFQRAKFVHYLYGRLKVVRGTTRMLLMQWRSNGAQANFAPTYTAAHWAPRRSNMDYAALDCRITCWLKKFLLKVQYFYLIFFSYESRFIRYAKCHIGWLTIQSATLHQTTPDRKGRKKVKTYLKFRILGVESRWQKKWK